MRSAPLVGLALAGAYLLGSLEHHARADDPAEQRLMQELVKIEREQADALKAIAAAEPTQRALREQTEALKSIARTLDSELARAQTGQVEALRNIAHAAERCTNR
jgi:hypothetical protein